MYGVCSLVHSDSAVTQPPGSVSEVSSDLRCETAQSRRAHSMCPVPAPHQLLSPGFRRSKLHAPAWWCCDVNVCVEGSVVFSIVLLSLEDILHQ